MSDIPFHSRKVYAAYGRIKDHRRNEQIIWNMFVDTINNIEQWLPVH